jgi:hypothetical protein
MGSSPTRPTRTQSKKMLPTCGYTEVRALYRQPAYAVECSGYRVRTGGCGQYVLKFELGGSKLWLLVLDRCHWAHTRGQFRSSQDHDRAGSPLGSRPNL